MKKFKSEDLLDQLQDDVKHIIAAAEHLKLADPVKLNYSTREGTWSAAQAIEHLNMYCRHYLPLVEKAMVPISKEHNTWFVSGFWGNYFTKMMKPTNVYEIKNRMKTTSRFFPDKGANVEIIFNEFAGHQEKLLHLMDLARKRDMNNIHIPIVFSRFIRLKLGDVFRFLVAHEQRHMIQARNTIKSVGISTEKFPVILEVREPQPERLEQHA